MTTDLILGTAGHIDHGKTSLVRALTGVDTDRLPEEKRRGITIELGFAELTVGDYRLGIVDVPGHERFVRNMLAGATGMDLAMLIVAADDSVKQQTREHVEILRLLQLAAGVVVITKCDLADAAWIELVTDEIRELVADTFLRDAPIVRVSVVTGQGLDELRTCLAGAAEAAARDREARLAAPFRLAIDRAFSIAGHGTVVTGSVSSGRTQIGDELVIEPGGLAVRVRGLQNHDRTVTEVHRGQRAAINLAGVHHQQIVRGQELAAPRHLRPSRRLTVELRLLHDARPLKSRTRVRLHVGTAERLSSVVLLDTERLEPGGFAYAQLYVSEPTVTTWGQPFVLRSESPVTTIGGGRVLDPDAERLRRPDSQVLALLAELRAAEPQRRAAAAAYFAGLRSFEPGDLARTAGVDRADEIYQSLREQGEVTEISLSPTRRLRVHRQVLEQLGQRIVAHLEKLHQKYPLRVQLDRAQVASAFAYLADPALFHRALESLRQAGRVRLSDKGVALAGQGPKLSANERKLLDQLIDEFRRARLQTPSVKQLQQQATHNQDSVPQLVSLAAANGDLVEVGPDFFLHADTDRQLQQQLATSLSASQGLTVSEIREILDTTRKYAVPYCEYLDRIGFTRRDGDRRVLARAEATAE